MRRFSFALVMAVCALLASMPAGLMAQDKPDKPAAKPAVAKPATVNINTATSAQIQTLPGIGVKAAEAIIEYRQKNGGFKKIEELMNVKGIGEKSFLKLKPLVTVGERADRAGTK